MGRGILNTVAGSAGKELLSHYNYYSGNHMSGNLNSQPNAEYWQLPFTKKKGQSESWIQVQGVLTGQGSDNYPWIGLYCCIDNHARGTNDDSTNNSASGGLMMCGPCNSYENVIMTIDKNFVHSSGSNSNLQTTQSTGTTLVAGNHNVCIGHSTRNGANTRWTYTQNPDSGKQNRNHNIGTSWLTIMEWAY